MISRNTRVGTNATFRYPSGGGGYGTVANALLRRVGDNLHTRARARAIDTSHRRIVFDNFAIGYSVLLSTIPLPEFARIATDMPGHLRESALSLRTNSIMVVNLGIDRSDLTNKHWIHFPERDISFFRISFPHNFATDVAPSGMSSISAEVSYPTDSPPDPKELTKRVVADLVKVGVLRADDRIVTAHSRDIPYGYCIFNEARRQALVEIKQWLHEVNIVPGGRYGLWTYFWSDEAMLSGKKSAELAQRRLAEIKGQPAPADFGWTIPSTP
jgi:protoporphyrinogen oxidase